ncbi:endonuclease [uncultured Paraglaciecola sp.]|uniref:endonuclease n=1 Tax=uncultured Paraglaciecola sp. TaxID=1765024 RepID=UPI0025EE50C3|nr:endonuclease [uncultured Paraglaciecola sp.]
MKNTTKTSVLMAILLSAQLAYANVSNGGFEDWSGATPDDWTTIDSGINVGQSTSVVRSGNSEAAVTVNTGSQASTDFRQSVNVTSGETYNFSVWVYHTEGNLRARLYVNGYQGYSTASTIGQWQEVTHSFTASSTTSIDVGLRFYDVSGFDGSEVVYVDDFEPNSGSSSGGGGTVGCSPGNLSLTTDNYGSETSWTIADSSANTLYSGAGLANNTSYSDDVCLDDSDYVFTINDSYGDGICCSYGSGSYNLVVAANSVASGGSFGASESTSFTIGSGGGSTDLSAYYNNAEGLNGYALKTALYNIIKGHSTQSYGALWTFYSANELDSYYENDGSILDIYSESPSSTDSYSYTSGSDQCGNYSAESDCYNREHSFPRSWFGGAVDHMNTDVHHIFATDGYVNSKRSSYPYGEVSSASYTSNNGSKVGSNSSALGYTGTVFEPIDEFKGDLARAYFYMATRYENDIDGWDSNSTYADAVLNGTSAQVYEAWFLAMLKDWHIQDPVSQKELDRNEAAYSHQGNRNPFVDYPSFVSEIWGN